MAKALESFKSYLIAESNKGPEQIRLAQYSFKKPEIFKKEFDNRTASLYDMPEQMDDDSPGLSKEENDQLKLIGLGNSRDIESMSVESLELEYDMIPIWDTAGIENMLFIPKKMKMRVDVETWDESKNTGVNTYIEIVDDNIGDRFEWEALPKNPFPIEPYGVEIHMNNSFDSSKFRYEFWIGEWR